jgi:DNA polymerase-3 subunit epsilon
VRLRAPKGAAAAAFADAAQPAGAVPWREAEWCAVDLELTGLNPQSDEIIAVGAVPIKEGRVVLGESLYTLVRSTKRSDHRAILVHKLRVDDLADAPDSDEAFDLLLGILRGRVPVFHASAIERTFLAPLFGRRRLRLPPSADTEALGRIWLAMREGAVPASLRLRELAGALGQEPAPSHHALGDALTTAQAFLALASHLDQTEPQTVGSILAAVDQLRPLRRMG